MTFYVTVAVAGASGTSLLFSWTPTEKKLWTNTNNKIMELWLPAATQLTPSPVKPVLQAHVNPPFVLVHAAFAWQLWVPAVHSSMFGHIQNTMNTLMHQRSVYMIYLECIRMTVHVFFTYRWASRCAGWCARRCASRYATISIFRIPKVKQGCAKLVVGYWWVWNKVKQLNSFCKIHLLFFDKC